MKIMTIVGARPNAMKAGPMSVAIREKHEEVILHTGQHFDFEMSELPMSELGIPVPKYNLGIHGGSPTSQIARMLPALEEVYRSEAPDCVIVIGDTNSTLASAIAGVHCGIPVCHVEAGPRNSRIDIPEMLNRILVDRCSSMKFCVTERNLQTLRQEGDGHGASWVGDLMLDAYKIHIKQALAEEGVRERLGLESGGFHLVTCHRAENVDDESRLRAIVDGLEDSDKPIVFPLHPRTRKMLGQFGMMNRLAQSARVIGIDPVGYYEFLRLGFHADKIITDSGGVQREAYFHEKPCICLFEFGTGWPEIEAEGWQFVAGADPEKIVAGIRDFRPTQPQGKVFGDGDAAAKIVSAIESYDFETAFVFRGVDG